MTGEHEAVRRLSSAGKCIVRMGVELNWTLQETASLLKKATGETIGASTLHRYRRVEQRKLGLELDNARASHRHFAAERLSDAGRRLLRLALHENLPLHETANLLQAVTGERISMSAICRFRAAEKKKLQAAARQRLELVLTEAAVQHTEAGSQRTFTVELKGLGALLLLLK